MFDLSWPSALVAIVITICNDNPFRYFGTAFLIIPSDSGGGYSSCD
jgi:hypothetical protein